MNREEILSMVDHTLLAQGATWEQIRTVCNDGLKYKTASVCIPAAYVKKVSEYLSVLQGGCSLEKGGDGYRLKTCTVIGFPNGYSTTASKVYETKDAIQNGADEIDMVINIGWVKDGLYKQVEDEIREIKAACGKNILKVIIETCLLEEHEKIAMCKIVTASGADFIKTSTGFAGGGVTFEDVKLFKDNVGENVKIKAAGGISSFEDAEKFIALGASRLGTSRLVKIAKAES
ncbi:MAG: deoxyribose-phosphate aldolase [Lachnospiraceae bacterium]|nr:deoxyribose-phosphate aldolase [Lachnospiraceae bacterium]